MILDLIGLLKKINIFCKKNKININLNKYYKNKLIK